MRTKTFEVRWTVVADRPELRNASYAPVAPGTKSFNRQVTTSQTQAIRLFEELLGGEWDFAAEYVAAAAVSQLYTGRSPRTVRRRVERERAETSRQRHRAILQVGAARRGALWLAFFHVDCCPVAPTLTDGQAESPAVSERFTERAIRVARGPAFTPPGPGVHTAAAAHLIARTCEVARAPHHAGA